MSDNRAAIYGRRLRALHEARAVVRGLEESADFDGVAIAADRALDCVYDLHEAYFQIVLSGTKKLKLPEMDDALGRSGGEVVGGLSFARGQKTHKITTPSRSQVYGEGVYGTGVYGLGQWVWIELATDHDAYRLRADWYATRVAGQPLVGPLNDAYAFFAAQQPK